MHILLLIELYLYLRKHINDPPRGKPRGIVGTNCVRPRNGHRPLPTNEHPKGRGIIPVKIKKGLHKNHLRKNFISVNLLILFFVYLLIISGIIPRRLRHSLAAYLCRERSVTVPRTNTVRPYDTSGLAPRRFISA